MNHSQQPLRALIDKKIEPLHWEDGPFYYPGLTRIRTIGGPSALFHAILLAYFLPYRTNKINHEVVNRHDMIKKLRESLALKLHQLAFPDQGSDLRVYDCLGKGKNKLVAAAIKSYSIEVMQSELLDTDFFIDDKYLELISNEIGKDIYFIDSRTKNVYVKSEDTDIFYKGRPSIVILILPNHFELIGIASKDDSDNLITHFSPDSPFIEYIRESYNQLKELQSYN